MARPKKSDPVVEVDDTEELDDLLEEDDDTEEVDTPAVKPKTKGDGPVERETYTAKQIATRIGTDPKTLRKFFRSPASTVEPCGQGGRYEFDAADLPKIKEEFEKFNSTKKPRGRQAGDGTAKAKTKGRSAPANATVIEEDDELLDLDDIEEEPSDEELLDLDEEADIEEIDEGLDEEDDAEDLEEDDDLEELDD